MKRRWLIFIIIACLLLVGSVAFAQTTHNDRETLETVSSEFSGGQYVLTIHSTAEPQPTGYRLLDSAPAADPAAGCCCKANLPCIIK